MVYDTCYLIQMDFLGKKMLNFLKHCNFLINYLNNIMLFLSFQMAHMFPDCIGEVDVVSDAENIKRLLKIPYSNKSVILNFLI